MTDLAEAKERAKEIDYLIRTVFGTEEGKRLMLYLEDRFLMKPVCPTGSKEGHGYWREGQNDLVRQFRAAIKRAEMGAYE